MGQKRSLALTPHIRDATPPHVHLQLPHIRDATPLHVLLQLPHIRDDATLGWGGVGWGGAITFIGTYTHT